VSAQKVNWNSVESNALKRENIGAKSIFLFINKSPASSANTSAAAQAPRCITRSSMVYIAKDWSDDEEEDGREIAQEQVISIVEAIVEDDRAGSDVLDHVYHDDNSLVATWQSALIDFKVRLDHRLEQ
jgi:hypothetical protein